MTPRRDGATAQTPSGEPLGTLAVALQHTHRLLQRDPRLAEQQCREILKVLPDTAKAHHLLGSALAAQQRHGEAIASLRLATRLNGSDAEAWRELAGQLLLSGDDAGADAAHAEELLASALDPRLQTAARALIDNDIPLAEHMLREHLRETPNDSGALRMLAEVGGRLGRYDDALAMLEHALQIAPGFAAARFNRALVLYRLGRYGDALDELDRLLAADPDSGAYNNLKAAVLSNIGQLGDALEHFETALAARPTQPKVWMSYGHSLKTIGRRDDGIAAYRRAIALEPRLGEAWWSLANLKSDVFAAEDIAAMTTTLARDDLENEDRFHLHFALGKALEDTGDAEQSFHHYAEGNRLRRTEIDYDPRTFSRRVEKARALFTPHFFAERSGAGLAAPDPIFIVGMPRSGSTLIEQILSSHPLVEGTQELPDILTLARREAAADGADYPRTLADIAAERLAELGAEYLDRTRIQRHTDRPHFIDKMPNNWMHAGFIHLILPQAKIIDARRHPLGCCFSNFKQHFALGQHFSYSLSDMGQYYASYVAMMEVIDQVLPGKVHRVYYEAMVNDTEQQVRRLLDYCGLDFDPACLSFHETDRAVRTASSEQVRRPIFREGLDQWRQFDRWLGPLRDSLGTVVDEYPFAT
jgi:tetratricopeptide (TPR) repeat protein